MAYKKTSKRFNQPSTPSLLALMAMTGMLGLAIFVPEMRTPFISVASGAVGFYTGGKQPEGSVTPSQVLSASRKAVGPIEHVDTIQTETSYRPGDGEPPSGL